MPRGSKASYSSKQKRQAEHIEEGYERRGVGRREAARLGHGQQGDRRRQEERLRPRQEDEPCLLAQGRAHRRSRLRQTLRRRALALGEKAARTRKRRASR
jgi:hypothetical protein